MYQIDNQSRRAVYEQIVEQTEKYILRGLLKAGDQMPSVRSLSIELSVNPNTVQKAYTELDRAGLIYTTPGRGSFVGDQAVDILRQNKRKALTDLAQSLREFALSGVSKAELTALLDQIFEEEHL